MSAIIEMGRAVLKFAVFCRQLKNADILVQILSNLYWTQNKVSFNLRKRPQNGYHLRYTQKMKWLESYNHVKTSQKKIKRPPPRLFFQQEPEFVSNQSLHLTPKYTLNAYIYSNPFNFYSWTSEKYTTYWPCTCQSFTQKQLRWSHTAHKQAAQNS